MICDENMSVISFNISATLTTAVPFIVTYTLNGIIETRTVGSNNDSVAQIWFDDGEPVTVQAPKTAQDGSITNTPPDLKSYRFSRFKLESSPPSFDQTWTGTPSDGDTLHVYYDEILSYQTRSPTRRATKLQAKTDEEVAQIRTTALKPLQVKNQAITSYEQTGMETKLGTVLCALGIVGNDQHHYRNFAQEIWGLKRTFTQLTLTNEAKLRANKWYARGLTWATLQTTAKLQGIDIGTAPP